MVIGCRSTGKLSGLLAAEGRRAGYHRLSKGIWAACLLLLPWLLTAVFPGHQPVASQSQATYEFGQFFHFSLLVQGSQPISGVTLFFRGADSLVTTTVDVAVEPALEIRAEHTVELTQIRLAPFSTITYWWQVTDTAGNVLEVPVQSIAYEDDRFDWHALSDENVVIRWTNEEAALGQTALDIVNDSLTQLAAIIPVALPEPLRIYIYPSASDLQSSLRLTGRDWVGGHANPELGVILVTAANARTAAVDLRQSIPHELTHLMLYQATGEAYLNLPRWLDEGLAVNMEAAPGPNEALILEESLASGTTIPFTELCTLIPLDGRQAVLAYAQSASLIDYIQAEYGILALNEMVSAVADGADCDSVSSRALNISLAQLNQDWLQSLSPQSPLVHFWQTGGIWLFLLIAGFGLMFVFLWPLNKDGH